MHANDLALCSCGIFILQQQQVLLLQVLTAVATDRNMDLGGAVLQSLLASAKALGPTGRRPLAPKAVKHLYFFSEFGILCLLHVLPPALAVPSYLLPASILIRYCS